MGIDKVTAKVQEPQPRNGEMNQRLAGDHGDPCDVTSLSRDLRLGVVRSAPAREREHAKMDGWCNPSVGEFRGFSFVLRLFGSAELCHIRYETYYQSTVPNGAYHHD
jgi:hypothetical protein